MFLEDSGREEEPKSSKKDTYKETGLVHQAGGRSLQSDLLRALNHPRTWQILKGSGCGFTVLSTFCR